MGVDPYVVFLKDQKVHGSIGWKREPIVLNIGRIASFQFVCGVFRLIRLLRDENIQIVHTLFDDASLLGAAVKSLAPRVSLIVSQRNLGYARHGIRRFLISRVLGACDKIVVNATAIGEFVGKQYGASSLKITVINNIHDDQPDCAPEVVERCMGHIRLRHRAVAIVVANLRQVKGIDDLLAAAAITRQIMDIGYVILGDGGGLEHYKDIVKTAGLENDVYLLGYQENTVCFLKGADVAILPSRSEGLSNSLVEYMFAGLPIVATDVGGNREALEDGRCGRLVQPANPAALAEAIVEIFNGGDTTRALGLAARDSAIRRYKQESIVQAYRELYWNLG